ncbi:MAG: hypothetical protein WKF81_07805, partial [Thermomicrobiales bacterium]
AEYTVIDALHRADRELEVLALPRQSIGPLWSTTSSEGFTPWHRHPPLRPPVSNAQLGFDFEEL